MHASGCSFLWEAWKAAGGSYLVTPASCVHSQLALVFSWRQSTILGKGCKILVSDIETVSALLYILPESDSPTGLWPAKIMATWYHPKQYQSGAMKMSDNRCVPILWSSCIIVPQRWECVQQALGQHQISKCVHSQERSIIHPQEEPLLCKYLRWLKWCQLCVITTWGSFH